MSRGAAFDIVKPRRAGGWQSRKGWGPEDCIQADIVHALRKALTPSAKVLAIPNGGKLTVVQRAKLFGGMGAMAGAPDLLVLWQGGLGFMEVKAPGKYPTPEQRAFAADLHAIGVPWACVKSVEDALAALEDWRAPRRDKPRRAA